MSKSKYLKMSQIYFSLIVFFILLIYEPAYSEVVYPQYTGENVVDMSGKFDNRYINSLKSELSQSANEVRIVFLDTKDKINLAFYAPKLFDKWEMPEDSVLVVIDPYLDKTGYGIGKKVLEEMKQRLAVKNNSKEKENSKQIDYDNLASAISDKFSPSQVKQENKTNTKNKKSNNSGSSENYNPSNSTGNNKKANTDSIIFSPLVIKILLAVLFLIIVSGGIGFFYSNKKRLKEKQELKTTYTFDADIRKGEILELIEKINKDIQKMNTYKGGTKKEVKANIEQLILWKNKGELFIERIDSEFEDIDIDDLGSAREILDEASLIKDELSRVHKESVDIRKDFKSTIIKSSMSISDIRVNLENCKVSLESIRTIYKLPLGISEDKIFKCEKYIEQISQLASENNPIEVRELSQSTYSTIKSIKKELEVIPHLYRQLQETIPITIESSLEENILDIHQRNKTKKEINDLKNDALISLSNGNLEHSEQLIKAIFDRITQIRSMADKT